MSLPLRQARRVSGTGPDAALDALVTNRAALVGLALLGVMTCLAAVGPLVLRVDPLAQDLTNAVQLPSSEHLLGTDSLGRDIASRMMYGARVSLAVALLPVAVALAFGLPVGLIAGYAGGWSDAAAMRIADAMLSFPSILLAIAIMGTLGPGEQNVVIALAFAYAPAFARLVRGSALAARRREFVIAAQAIGASDIRVILRHILPEVVAPLTVQATASFATAIVAESTLSFLGLGTQPPTPSWGAMLNEARSYLSDAPWFALVPASAITLAVLSVNFLGDGLRDALDPRRRRR